MERISGTVSCRRGLRQLCYTYIYIGVEAKLVVLGFGLVGMLVHIAIHGFGYWLGMYLGWVEQGKLAAWFGLCRAELSVLVSCVVQGWQCVSLSYSAYFSHTLLQIPRKFRGGYRAILCT